MDDKTTEDLEKINEELRKAIPKKKKKHKISAADIRNLRMSADSYRKNNFHGDFYGKPVKKLRDKAEKMVAKYHKLYR